MVDGGRGDGWDFYVSCAPEDQDWGAWAAWELETAGYTVLLPAWDATPGTNLPLLINRAVQDARRTIAFVTAAYELWTLGGVDWAAAFFADPAGEERRLLTVRVDGHRPAGVLGQVVAVDLADVAGPAARVRLLSAAGLALSGGRAKPPVAPPYPVRGSTSAEEFPGRPWQLPPPSSAPIVPRPQLEAALLAALLEPATPLIGVEGPPGFGKTALTAVVCDRDEVRAGFPGGLLWVAVGQDRHGPSLTALLDDLAVTLTGAPTGLTDPVQAASRVAKLLAGGPPVLLVVDDAWSASQLAPFRAVGRACRLLVTTRVVRALPTGTRVVSVEEMTDDEARELLCGQVGDLPGPLARRLLDALGRWPLPLSLANGTLRADLNAGATPAQAAEALADQLAAEGPAVLDIRDETSRDSSLHATLEVSLNGLTAAERLRFGELAMFPEDTAIPLDVIALLWAETGGLSPGRSKKLVDELDHRRLARRQWTYAGPMVDLHDVVRTLLRHDLGPTGLQEGHAAFVAAARRLTADTDDRTDWSHLPDNLAGDYLAGRLIDHLVGAGLTEDAAAVATDLRWVAASLVRTGSTLTAEIDLAIVATGQARALARSLAGMTHLLYPPLPANGLAPTLAAHIASVPELAASAAAYTRMLTGTFFEVVWSTLTTDTALLRVLAGHTGAVNTVAFSPDGALLATGGDDRTVRLWDVDLGTEVAVVSGYRDGVGSVAFSPDGRLLATGSIDVLLWDLNADTEPVVLTGRHFGRITSLAFSPDGQLLAAGGGHLATLWNVATAIARVSIHPYPDDVRTVAFSPNGEQLATAGRDGSLRLWSSDTGAEHVALYGISRGGVQVIAFSPDGQILAVGGKDETIYLWDTTSDAETPVTFPVSTEWLDAVNALAFSPDGRLLATAGDDRALRIWDATSRVQRATLTGHTAPVNAVAFAPDGQAVATGSGDHTTRLWNPHAENAPGRRLWTLGLGHASHGWLLAACTDEQTGWIYRAATGAQDAVHVGGLDFGSTAAFSPDGRLLATVVGRSIRLSDTSSGTVHTRFDPAPRSPDGAANYLKRLAFSPDGRLIVSTETGPAVRIWNTATGDQHVTFTGWNSEVGLPTFSADGSLLAASTGRTAVLWNIATDSEHARLDGHHTWVRTIAASPDSRLIATGDDVGEIRLWNLADGTEHTTITGHLGKVTALGFTPDGQFLAAGSHDGTVLLWDLHASTVATSVRLTAPITNLGWHQDELCCATDQALGTTLLRLHS